jgi:hypothetical protein
LIGKEVGAWQVGQMVLANKPVCCEQRVCPYRNRVAGAMLNVSMFWCCA